MKIFTFCILSVLFTSLSSLSFAKQPIGVGKVGGGMKASTSSTLPPGLNTLPPGLKKQGKIPPGWSKGQKKGWTKSINNTTVNTQKSINKTIKLPNKSVNSTVNTKDN